MSAACWKCAQTIEPGDNYCRHCGAGQGRNVAFYYKSWGVWFLFFLIGPFNLWFLYRSPVISRKLKLVWAAVFIVASVWFCYTFYTGVKNILDLYTPYLTMPY